MHNTKFHAHVCAGQATSTTAQQQQQQFAHRFVQAIPSVHEPGFSTKAPRPEPLSNNPTLHGFPNHTQIPTGPRKVYTTQDAILEETLAIGATILRTKIPYVMPSIHIQANGTFTVTWVPV
jgi:hypothetical protein